MDSEIGDLSMEGKAEMTMPTYKIKGPFQSSFSAELVFLDGGLLNSSDSSKVKASSAG